MLILDGVRYKLWTPKDEEKEFHPMIREHSKEIFGENSIYFDIKHLLKSKSGIGSIPDAYVIDLSKPHEWYIVENELASHRVYDHVFPQVSKFIDAIERLENQKEIRDVLYEEITRDKVLKASVEKMIHPEEIHHFLSILLSKSPTIIVVIDRITEEVDQASNSLRKLGDTKVVEFRTFVRENAETVHAHLFEPLYEKAGVEVKIEESIEEKIMRTGSEDIRNLLREATEQLRLRNFTLKPLKGRWMSVWFKGKRFMYLASRERWFICQIQRPDGKWTESIRIKSREDWNKVFESSIRPIISQNKGDQKDSQRELKELKGYLDRRVD